MHVNASTVSRLLSEGRRPSSATLRAIAHELTNDLEERRKFVYAHLLDEIDRAGMGREMSIRVEGALFSHDSAELARMLAVLAKAGAAVAEVETALAMLDGLLCRNKTPPGGDGFSQGN